MEDIEDVVVAGAPLGLRLPVSASVGVKPKRKPKARLVHDPLLSNPRIPGTQICCQASSTDLDLGLIEECDQNQAYRVVKFLESKSTNDGSRDQPAAPVLVASGSTTTRSLPLPWSVRMKIALGAAKGLAFLHEEAERPIIYRDFKTSNILLDVDYNAKLSDFGLAKDGPEGDKTHVSTWVMETYGYAAPEL